MTLNELIQACFRRLKEYGECDSFLKEMREGAGLSEENERVIRTVVADGKSCWSKF